MAGDRVEKALKYGRMAMDRWRRGDYPRVAHLAGRAETVLFRLICTAGADVAAGLAASVAYGEIASVRSVTLNMVRTRITDSAALAAARSSLWALDRADPSGGSDVGIWSAIARGDAPPTPFVWEGDGPGVLPAVNRIIAAADAKLLLAERLAARERRQAGKQQYSAESLDYSLRSREKFYSSDEFLIGDYRTDRTWWLDSHQEAYALAEEAVHVYRLVADASDHLGEGAVDEAEARRDAVGTALARPA